MRLGVPRFLKPILYAAVTLVIAVCALEIGLRVKDSHERRMAQPETSGDGLVVPSWTVHHELKPLRRVDFISPDGEQRVSVRTNSYGLRGGEPVVPKPPQLFRILCLGDEMVLGPDVDEGETIPQRLEALLESRSRGPIEVLNAGTPGDCPLISYLRLRHSLAALRPDVVVVAFEMGDVADDYRLRRHVEVADGNVPVACPSPELRRRESKPVAETETFLLPGWLKEQVTGVTADAAPAADNREIDSPRGRFAWLKPDRRDWDVYVEQSFTAFDHLQSVCDEIGCTLVVAVHPAPWQVAAGACCPNLRRSLGVGESDFYRGREPFDRLGAYLAKRRIAFCDGSEAFRGATKPESLYLVNAPRFSKAGHDLQARVLATYLLQRVDGPWSNGPGESTQPTPRTARDGTGGTGTR